MFKAFVYMNFSLNFEPFSSPDFLPTCAACAVLPSYISTMGVAAAIFTSLRYLVYKGGRPAKNDIICKEDHSWFSYKKFKHNKSRSYLIIPILE